jgi:hypothetical protein
VLDKKNPLGHTYLPGEYCSLHPKPGKEAPTPVASCCLTRAKGDTVGPSLSTRVPDLLKAALLLLNLNHPEKSSGQGTQSREKTYSANSVEIVLST